MNESETAGVRFPPPLLFVAGLGAAALLDRALPLAAGYATRWGWLLVLLGAALDIWALATLRRAKTTFLPWGRADALATSGPFRFTRNPIYLGYALAYGGLALVIGSWWAWPFAALVIHLTQALVIGREERHLAARFGEAFEAYRARVRRWL